MICLFSFLVHIRGICADEVFEYRKGILSRISLLSAAPLLTRLELATSSSRPLPPDALSVRPALAFQVPIRSLSHGCSAVLRSRISRSPALRFVSLLHIYPSDPVPVIAYASNPFILFFPLGSTSRRQRPLSSGPEVPFRASRALFRCLFILRHGPGRDSGLGI